MKMKYLSSFVFLFLLVGVFQINAQVVTWGPANPAVSSNNMTTCYEETDLNINFTNSAAALVAGTMEVQLDIGINYVPGSIVVNAGPTTITEFDFTDLNRPIFNIGALASGEAVSITLKRTANCEARDKKIAGGTFTDAVHIYENGTEVAYSNGLVNGMANYDIIYASLSITNISTTPPTNNLGSSSTRSVLITNGSFGPTEEFYYADIFTAGSMNLSNFTMNAGGINYVIPASNISIVGDSVIIHFTPTEIAAIDGSAGTTGDGDGIFEIDEQFNLTYLVTPNNCGISNTLSSDLATWWGCSYENRCQTTVSASSLGITNATPSISLSNASTPKLDFCDTVVYSVTLTNTSPETFPAGGSFASDVTAILGFRANASLIATENNMTMWGSSRYANHFFANHTLNGFPVSLPTMTGLFNTQVPYLPPNYFTTDPDGPGGLTDVDGDGFFDDLPIGESLVISYGVYIDPVDTSCGVGLGYFGRWEHISADISWYNQCGTLMSPIRQEFNYTNHIRDYLNSSFFNFPSDISDGEDVTVGILPHMYTSYNCNGEPALTGSYSDWIVSVILPGGFSMQPGYDPSIYTVTNDTVSVITKYQYDWTNFPLHFDCSGYDPSIPLALEFKTTQICTNGVDTCFIKDIHCFNAPVVPHCPGPCVGVNPLNFEVNRISESWTDATQTALVDIDDPNIVKNFVYAYDTVAFETVGVMVDTMTNNLFVEFDYSPQNGGDIFDYFGGEITIVDVDGQYNGGQTDYTFPLTSGPTISSLGGNNYKAVFDLSSYRTLIDPNYHYGQSVAGPPGYDPDSIKFTAYYVIKNTFNSITKWDVNNFRSTFFLYDLNGDEVTCNSWGTQLSYEQVNVRATSYTTSTSGCQSRNQLYYFIHQAATGDNHPDEYRPPFQIDSVEITIPPGWDIGTILWIDASVMTPSDYTLAAGILTLRRPAAFTDFDKRNTYYPRFSVEMIPNCGAPAGRSYVEHTIYYHDFAYLTDDTKHVAKTATTTPGYITYTPPTITVTPLNQSVPAITDTVSWNVRICNSTSNDDVGYNWLLLDNNSGNVFVDSILDVTSGAVIPNSTTATGETYLEIGALNQGECSEVQIFAHYTSCDVDSLNIAHGWSCLSYPNTTNAATCGVENQVFVLPQTAAISTTITPLEDTPTDTANPANGNYGTSSVDMCSEFPVEFKVVNGQPGYLSDIMVNIQIPSGGSGLSYVPGSATIELEGVDPVNVPRPFGSPGETTLNAMSGSAVSTWTIPLADIDPTNFGNGEPLPGTSQASHNEFIIRLKMTANCSLISGDQFIVVINGNEACDGPAEGDGEQINGSPINLNGITNPYYSFFSSSVSPNTTFRGCSETKTVDVNLLISGGSSTASDSLFVTLPPGTIYDGNLICNTPGKCPNYVSSTFTGGVEVAKFAYPAGQSGTINFEFDMTADGRGTCSNTSVMTLRNVSIVTGLSCGGSSCSNSSVVTGLESYNVTLEKPILGVNLIDITTTNGLTPNTFTYELELSNTGIDTEDDVIVDFYCLNAAGDDIVGAVVGSDTLSSLLLTNQMATLSGSFDALCNPDDGVVAIIPPSYDNCYCGSLDDMSEKSPGLNDFPFSERVNVPLPIELNEFSIEDEGCSISVKWETMSEVNHKYFYVQSSSDQVIFNTISINSGKGSANTLTTYEFIDHIDPKDKQLYYRLKIVANNGDISYSSVQHIMPKDCGKEVGDFLSVYPNPVKNGTEVSVVYENESYNEVANLKVISMFGHVVIDYDLTNLEQGINDFKVDLSRIPAGNYFLQVENSEGRFSRVKISVMKL